MTGNTAYLDCLRRRGLDRGTRQDYLSRLRRVERALGIAISPKSRDIATIRESIEAVERRGVPEWLMLEKDSCSGQVMAWPSREQLTTPLREHLIVELYSK